MMINLFSENAKTGFYIDLPLFNFHSYFYKLVLIVLYCFKVKYSF